MKKRFDDVLFEDLISVYQADNNLILKQVKKRRAKLPSLKPLERYKVERELLTLYEIRRDNNIIIETLRGYYER